MEFITFIVSNYNLLQALRLNFDLKKHSVVTLFTKNQITACIIKCIYLVLRDRKASTWRIHNIMI
jgi:uncharacterized protein YehS (DUF1456 family)